MYGEFLVHDFQPPDHTPDKLVFSIFEFLQEANASPSNSDSPTQVPDAAPGDAHSPSEAPDAADGNVHSPTEVPDAAVPNADSPSEAPDAAPGNADCPSEAPDAGFTNFFDPFSENWNFGDDTMNNDEGDERTVILNNESEETHVASVDKNCGSQTTLLVPTQDSGSQGILLLHLFSYCLFSFFFCIYVYNYFSTIFVVCTSLQDDYLSQGARFACQASQLHAGYHPKDYRQNLIPRSCPFMFVGQNSSMRKKRKRDTSCSPQSTDSVASRTRRRTVESIGKSPLSAPSNKLEVSLVFPISHRLFHLQ